MPEFILFAILVVFVGAFVVWPAWKEFRRPLEWEDVRCRKPRCTVRPPAPCQHCGVMVENPTPMAIVLQHGHLLAIATTILCQECLATYWTAANQSECP